MFYHKNVENYNARIFIYITVYEDLIRPISYFFFMYTPFLIGPVQEHYDYVCSLTQ